MKAVKGLGPDMMFADGGELGALIRSHDWATTPLGPVKTWPQSLCTMVCVLLGSSQPMFILWGTELTLLYNDSYRSTLGLARHPQALGASGLESWPFLAPVVAQVMSEGQAATISQLQQFIPYDSFQEERYYSFCCSPIYDELSQVGGVLVVCNQTTGQVISDRRLKTLRSLHKIPSSMKTARAACHQTLGILSGNPYDIPFALLYLVEADALRLVGSAGIAADTAASPLIVNLTAARTVDSNAPALEDTSPETTSLESTSDAPWSLEREFARVCSKNKKSIIDNLSERFEALLPKALTDTWNNSISSAVVKPLASPDSSQVAGLLVMGISPTKNFDEDYQDFFDLVADHIDQTVVGAKTHAAKRTQIARLIRQERAAKDARRQMKLALTTGKIGTWEIALKTQTLTACDQHRYNHGLSADATLTVDTMRSRIHLDDRDRVWAAYHTAIEQGDFFDEEYRMIWDDGSTHWMIARAELTYDRAGEPDRLVGISIEITERKRAEQAAIEGEQRFRKIVESNLFGVVLGNLTGGLTYANDYVLNLLGYSAQELASSQLSWDQLTPPEFASSDVNAVDQLLETGVCKPYEKEYICKDGSKLPILIAATLLQNASAQSQEVMAFVLDLTRLKQLTEERDRFFRLSPDMYAVGTLEGYFTYVNSTWEKVLGYTSQELTMRPYLSFVHPDDRAATIAASESLSTGEELVAFENRYGCKDGSYRWLSWNVTNLLSEGQFYAVARNITALKNDAIEREAAREAAERANRIKDEFLAVVSHELRSPLNPILGWSQLLKRGTLSAEKTKFAIASIERNAQLQLQLISDLLDISRILRGKLVLDKTPTDLNSVILAAKETVKQAADEKSIEIKTTTTPCYVLGDAVRLQQVMWNLLSNAVKFTPNEGQITITATTEASVVKIEVSDTGKGIAADFVPFVFEHFRQENYSTTRKFGGLGLGLAIVRQIVDLHDGTVTVHSPGEDQGATFVVQLPCVVVPDLPSVGEPNIEKGNLSGINILVIDDESDSIEITAFSLEEAGAAVTVAASGDEALAAMGKALPDIIISDIGMPKMDGYMLIEQIRALPANRGGQVRAIALTAYATAKDEMRALETGFQQHLTKPIAPDTLIKAILEVLDSEAPK
ncbi:MAG: PAS domain-containing protein [Phormidesmis sp.]